MEPDFPSVTPRVEDSDPDIISLMADHQPPHNAVPQVPSDGEHVFLSHTSTQPATPPVSQLETTSMPDESVIPCPTLSDSLPETPHNASTSDDYQPAIISGVHVGAHDACASPSHDSAKYLDVPLDSGSDDNDNTHAIDSIQECGSPFVVLSAPSDSPTSPLFVPLPESDDEDYSSESTRDGGVPGTVDGMSQDSDANTTSTGGRTSPSSGPAPPNAVQPSKHSHLETPFNVHASIARHGR